MSLFVDTAWKPNPPYPDLRALAAHLATTTDPLAASILRVRMLSALGIREVLPGSPPPSSSEDD